MLNNRGRRTTPAAQSNKKEMSTEDFSQMRHRYYIVRPEPNKTCVPLIALDELPANLRIKGIPLNVTAQQIMDWDMARAGDEIEGQESFEIEFDSSTRLKGRQGDAAETQHSAPEDNIEPSPAKGSQQNLIVEDEDESEKLAKSEKSANITEKSDNTEKSGIAEKIGSSENVGTSDVPQASNETKWRPISELEQDDTQVS